VGALSSREVLRAKGRAKLLGGASAAGWSTARGRLAHPLLYKRMERERVIDQAERAK
jgi:hypothetical protein